MLFAPGSRPKRGEPNVQVFVGQARLPRVCDAVGPIRELYPGWQRHKVSAQSRRFLGWSVKSTLSVTNAPQHKSPSPLSSRFFQDKEPFSMPRFLSGFPLLLPFISSSGPASSSMPYFLCSDKTKDWSHDFSAPSLPDPSTLCSSSHPSAQ